MFKIDKKFKNIIFLLLFSLFAFNAYSQELYWERPLVITKTDARFPRVISNENANIVIWQEVDEKKHEIYLSSRNYKDLDNYQDSLRFAGPFAYSGDSVPDLFSAAINKKGILLVTAIDSVGGIHLYSSENYGNSFTHRNLSSKEIMVAPRLYVDINDNFRIFTSVGADISFSIYTATSKDGLNWSDFEEFAGSKDMRLPFVPVLIPYNNEDYVVFQAQYLIPGRQQTIYQLYMTHSADGVNWSSPLLVTDHKSLLNGDRKNFYEYANQRPYLYNFKDKLYLAWERSETSNTVIYVAELTDQGILQRSVDDLSGRGTASRPIIFEYQDNLYTSWFDTRRGQESLYLAKKNGNIWDSSTLVADSNSNLYVYPLLVSKKNEKSKLMNFIYQQVDTKKRNSIALLSPDLYAAPPSFSPQNFRADHKSKNLDVKVKINFPDDISRIRGYSYTWSKNPDTEPRNMLLNTIRDENLKLKADKGDGDYYLKVKVQDRAGNWSQAATLTYRLDTMPPKAPKINLDNLDENKLLSSNNFNFTWESSPDPDAISYLYSIEKISDVPRIITQSKKHPLRASPERLKKECSALQERFNNYLPKLKNKRPAHSTTNLNTSRYYNLTNGLYAILVSAVDDVGNVSLPQVEMFILNKYEPTTYITSVSKEETQQFDNVLTIFGGGFTYDGLINQVIVDRDGKAPYDLILSLDKKEFRVDSNSKISNINLGTDLEEGNYRILLRHSDRGLYVSNKAIKIVQRGTVKIEPEFTYKPRYSQNFIKLKYKISIYFVLIALFLLLGLMGVLTATYNINLAVNQLKRTNMEINNLMTGAPMAEQKLSKKGKRQKSLKYILVGFTYFLIVAIVLAVSMQSGLSDIRLQKSTLSNALLERTEVLLQSLSANVRSFMPSENKTEIAALPTLKNAMSEAHYVTIVGQKSGSNNNKELNYLWASDDPEIRQKIDGSDVNYGYSKITDQNISTILKTMEELEEKVKEQVNDLEVEISKIDEDLRHKNPEIDSDFEELADRKSKLISQINNKISKESDLYSSSLPAFDQENLSIRTTDYIYTFYRPVLYRQGSSRQYVHSVIIMELSIENLIKTMQEETMGIIRNALIIALVASIIGLLGSLMFASFIIKPVKLLEQFVDRFGRAKSKKTYNKTEIRIKQKRSERKKLEELNEEKNEENSQESENNNEASEEENKKLSRKERKERAQAGKEIIELKDDEIGRLGIAINRMKDQIIANEIEMELQLDGSEVQNSFLPLEKGTSHSQYEDKNIQLYGYYLAQTGVSGDCFDYKKLDDDWYIFLKSDASGHGSPAAFIMTVVATYFKQYVKDWSFKKNGTRINEVVYQINDFINGLGLRGKFATMLVALLNHKTGELYLCNAGDNLVNIYRNKTHKVEVLTLNSCPTTGVFDSNMIKMGTGYKVEKNHLEKGDILFLYTDGIEESTRRLRNPDFTVQQTQTESLQMNEKTHQREKVYKTEDKKEEFGPDRVRAVIEAVENKRKFILTKEENPMLGESLEFDFTKSDASLHDLIFALASCEKVFRLYKPQGLQAGIDYIEIDKEIDAFLSTYFNLYDFYSNKKEDSVEKANFLNYELITEDEQGDDLTLLAVKRL
ncbi:MAG: SpoIIE family protein phosphatase [Treponema sp.]|nr:SpoIIE family protein phosphatase [Treponema sp.]